MDYYIYLHIKATNGEPFYVGKGKDRRAVDKTNRSLWWHNIVNKHGYDIIILEENLTENDAFELEQYWIKRIGRKDLGLGSLVNLTDGGELGNNRKKTDETKEKLRQAKLGTKFSKEVNLKKGMKGEKNPMYGKSAMKGRKHSDDSIEKMKVSKGLICVNIETGIFYNSIRECSELNNINEGTLYYQLKNNKNKKLKLI